MALKVNYEYFLNYYSEHSLHGAEIMNSFCDIDTTITKKIIFKDAYLVINSINGSKNKLDVIINVYTDSNKTDIIDSKEYSFVPSVEKYSGNFIEQGYNFLKGSVYMDSSDIFEENQN